MSDELIEVPLLRFPVRAILRRRRARGHGYSLNMATVVAGSLTLDFSGIEQPRGTVGVVDFTVFAGRLEIVVARGVDAHLTIRAQRRGRVVTRVGGERTGPHLLVAGRVGFGTVVVREAGPPG